MKLLITGGSGFIGRHLAAAADQSGFDVITLDVASGGERSNHLNVDLKNHDATREALVHIQPDAVVHLAAKADLNGTSVDDFPDNVIGTANLLNAVDDAGSVQHVILTSTQFVVTPGVSPPSEEFLQPYTAYGQSKAATEQMLRSRTAGYKWTIIRPTNVWGPGHRYFPYELWPYLAKGFYLHPGYSPIIKNYGYVGNVCSQILGILGAPTKDVDRRVYYVTDAPMDSAEWMRAFARAFGDRDIRRIPRVAWRALSLCGDVAKASGFRFPMSSDRYFRLTVQEAAVLHHPIVDLLGVGPYSFDAGVRACVDWCKVHVPRLG